MNLSQWDILKSCAGGQPLDHTPAALIVDSPWMPGYLGISTLDYLTIPDVWLKANLHVEREFSKAIFLPGFWVEMGMTAEPSAFGCRVSLYPDRTPVAHPIAQNINQLADLPCPDPRTDGFLPVVINYYRRMEPQVNDAGQLIKVVAARGPLTLATHLMGVTDFLLALKLNPRETHRLLKTTTTLVRTWLEAQAEVLREPEGIMVLDDIAGFLSPKDYLEFAHPYLKEVFDAFPRSLKIFHNDTDNPVSYPYLPELGVQIFNFTHLQPIEKVRVLVGPNVCLMGNVPPLDVMVGGTPDQVIAETRKCLSACANQPGLLLSVGGGVSPGTPGANLAALIDTAIPETSSSSSQS